MLQQKQQQQQQQQQRSRGGRNEIQDLKTGKETPMPDTAAAAATSVLYKEGRKEAECDVKPMVKGEGLAVERKKYAIIISITLDHALRFVETMMRAWRMHPPIRTHVHV
jgi:hypothetical protein